MRHSDMFRAVGIHPSPDGLWRGCWRYGPDDGRPLVSVEVVVSDADTRGPVTDATSRWRADVPPSANSTRALAFESGDARDVAALAVAVENDLHWGRYDRPLDRPGPRRGFDKGTMFVHNPFADENGEWRGRVADGVKALADPSSGYRGYRAWRDFYTSVVGAAWDRDVRTGLGLLEPLLADPDAVSPGGLSARHEGGALQAIARIDKERAARLVGAMVREALAASDEVAAGFADGSFPPDVSSFSDLHDHCDANMLASGGAAFDDPALGIGVGVEDWSEAYCGAVNFVQFSVERGIRDGSLLARAGIGPADAPRP